MNRDKPGRVGETSFFFPDRKFRDLFNCSWAISAKRKNVYQRKSRIVGSGADHYQGKNGYHVYIEQHIFHVYSLLPRFGDCLLDTRLFASLNTPFQEGRTQQALSLSRVQIWNMDSEEGVSQLGYPHTLTRAGRPLSTSPLAFSISRGAGKESTVLEYSRRDL